MASATILLTDHLISQKLLPKLLSGLLGLEIMDMHEELRRELPVNATTPVREINDFIIEGKGKYIPNKLLTAFAIGKLNNRERLLLVNYPKNSDQYQQLSGFLTTESFWFIKVKDPDNFYRSCFNEPNMKAGIEKYNDNPLDILNKWKEDHKKRREGIESILNITDHSLWKIVEMDYQSPLNENDLRIKLMSKL
jgi:adenylate kinase family enzyme